MHRHIRQSCKIAGSDEGMEKLMDHTLARQNRELRTEVAEMRAQAAAQNAQMQEQIAELAALLRRQLVVAAPPEPRAVAHAPPVRIETLNNGPVQNTTINQVINLVPWDGAHKISIATADVAAAFAENRRLREYTGYNDHELADHKIASPYVTELFMDLVKRAHAAPESRNVYLNPRRADQVLVHLRNGQWEVRSVAEATRLLFDGVAEGIHRTVLSWEELRRLPLEAQNALAIAGMLYEEKPDEYVERARAPMVAHLMNTAPGPALEAGPP
jgi:hypothetical protein